MNPLTIKRWEKREHKGCINCLREIRKKNKKTALQVLKTEKINDKRYYGQGRFES